MQRHKIVDTLIRLLAIALLVFNGAGAFYGGTSLILHPDGSGMQLSLSLLAHTPFHDYFIPGIVLLVSIGLCSFLVLAITIRRVRRYYLYIISQGGILLGWIIIQVLLIRTINTLHITMGLTGVGLMLLGLVIFDRMRADLTRNTTTDDYRQ